MTPKQIRKDFFENIVDDTSYDSDFVYQLFNQAKNKIEDEFDLEILKDIDSTKTNAVGDNYLSMKTLPTDWRKTLKMVVGNVPYSPISFIHREQWKDSGYKYYIDYKNNQFAICGRGAGNTIHHFYLVTTDDITLAQENNAALILWPSRFQPLIAYEAAYIIQSGVDADAMSFRMSPTQLNMREELKNSFRNWDMDLKLGSMGNQGGFAENVEGDWPIDNEGHIPNLGNM